ncbi:hypothetical protein DFS34DRAFT_595969 [Phlyctochytrium arcticum]|nr:hypothetical protein DFS34DRAFT_595969 [Phlyctochytrium arcticum]
MRGNQIFRLTLLLLAFLALAHTACASSSEDGDDDFDEDDDVDYAPPVSTRKLGRNQIPLDTAGSVKASTAGNFWDDNKISDFTLEIFLVAGTIAYLVSHYVGKGKTNDIARNWIALTLPTWEHNFASVGNAPGHKLTRDGPRDYVFFASGRRHVKSVYGQLHLAARYDIYQWLLDIVQPEKAKDTLTLIATLNEEESDPVVFSILHKKIAADVKKQRWDLANFQQDEFTAARDGSFPGAPFPGDYQLRCDSKEFVTGLWEEERIRRALYTSIGLDRNGNGTPLHTLIEQIILTDLPTVKPESLEDISQAGKTITMTLQLPNLANLDDRESEAIVASVDLLLAIVDYVGQCGRLSQDTLAKSLKMRQAAEVTLRRIEEQKRKEELAQKKFQQKKDQSQLVAKLSPEEQRKHEERERKKQLKRDQSKKMKKGKVMMS